LERLSLFTQPNSLEHWWESTAEFLSMKAGFFSVDLCERILSFPREGAFAPFSGALKELGVRRDEKFVV